MSITLAPTRSAALILLSLSRHLLLHFKQLLCHWMVRVWEMTSSANWILWILERTTSLATNHIHHLEVLHPVFGVCKVHFARSHTHILTDCKRISVRTRPQIG